MEVNLITNNEVKCLTYEKLTKNTLDNLLRDDILAVKIPNYMSKDIIEPATNKVLEKEYGYYEYTNNSIGRYGMSFFETKDNDIAFKKYYKSSKNYIEEIRNFFEPYLSPMDKLRLNLEEVWPEGANLESIDRKNKMFVGLLRAVENKGVLPHQDDLNIDVSFLNRSNYQNLEDQWACNIYMQLPEEGGEIEIWDNKNVNTEKYKLKSDFYGFDRSLFPEPDLTIKPNVGDLLIFKCKNYHAVRGSINKGVRLSISCFIGYRGNNSPLTYWS